MEYNFENGDLDYVNDCLGNVRALAMAAAGAIDPEIRFAHLQKLMDELRWAQQTLVEIDRSPEAREDIERII